MADVTQSPLSISSRLLRRIGGRCAPIMRNFRKVFNLDMEYRFSNFSIALPADHRLPTYQRAHRLYDKFLPHLCKHLEAGSTVVDVGANCGDTVAAMYDANPELSYICIEPDEEFFAFLQRNVLRITERNAHASIQTVKVLIGKTITGVTLRGSGGTKKATVGAVGHALSSKSLDQVLAEARISDVRVLKSDVDGFDYDVIQSAEGIISRSMPIIYFECQFDHPFQKTEYEKLMAMLHSKGYVNWLVFDNFGNVLLRADNIQLVCQLFEYVWRQNTQQATRTIYYYDILATSSKDSEWTTKVLQSYIGSA